MSYKYEELPIKKLIPYANNSRTHSDEQIKQIAASITEFGFTNPVLIDENNGIIAGHGRVIAAELLEMDKLPTIRMTGLTEAQKKAYVLADNQLALNAGWDMEMLKLELQSLDELDFDLDLIGFEPDFLDELLNEQEENIGDGDYIEDKEELLIVVELDTEEEQSHLYKELHSRGFKIKIME